VIKTAHSRFPVTDGDKDNIIGILLAKDLLRYYAGKSSTCATSAPAVFVPEAKRPERADARLPQQPQPHRAGRG